MDAVIVRAGQSPIILHAPTDRALASLWELAQLEVEARDGYAAVTQSDWAAVTARYHELVTERRAELGAFIREIQAPEPPTSRPAVNLRTHLTPFGEQIAALRPRGVSVVSPADAVEPMRQILRALSLPQPENPGVEARIRQWTNSDSAILLYHDAEGQPVKMRFLTRIAADTIKTVYRVGGGAPAGRDLLQVAWDLEIRRIVAEFHEDQAPESWKRAGGIEGLTERLVTPRGDGWFDQVETLLRRP
jgi:hypothetical protein